jgi:hypothetical protein
MTLAVLMAALMSSNAKLRIAKLALARSNGPNEINF